MDGLNLHDLRQSKKVSEEQYSRMEELEARRRALLRELQNAKASLDLVHKTENFNDGTGSCSGSGSVATGCSASVVLLLALRTETFLPPFPFLHTAIAHTHTHTHTSVRTLDLCV